MIKLRALLFGCCTGESRQSDPEIVSKKSNQDSNANRANAQQKYETDIAENGHSSKILKISPEEVVAAPLLVLKATEGNILPLDSEIVINAAGVTTNGRNKRDGTTYVGSQKYKISVKTGQQRLMNDILLNDASVGERHCMIKYNLANKKYLIKDLGEGSGSFVKIEQELKLKSGCIISFSDSHLVISISDGVTPQGAQKALPKDTITLKFLDGPKIDQTFSFSKDEKLIKIGRMNDCLVKFEGNSFSRYQCSIEFKDSSWYISDGLNGKSSTNGSWLFAEEFNEILDGMVLKVGQTLFKVALITQKKDKQ